MLLSLFFLAFWLCGCSCDVLPTKGVDLDIATATAVFNCFTLNSAQSTVRFIWQVTAHLSPIPAPTSLFANLRLFKSDEQDTHTRSTLIDQGLRQSKSIKCSSVAVAPTTAPMWKPRSTQVSTTTASSQTTLAQGDQCSSSGWETSSLLPGKHTLGNLSAGAAIHTRSPCTIISQKTSVVHASKSGFKTLRSSPGPSSPPSFDSSGFLAVSPANRTQDLRLQAGQTQTASHHLVNEDNEVPDPFPVFSWMTITTSAAIVIPVVPASTDTYVVTSTTTDIQVTTTGTLSSTFASVTIASSLVSSNSL